MKLSNSQRHFAFLKAKSLDPALGDLFQNEMEIKAKDVSSELDRLHQIEQLIQRKIKGYRKDLTDILEAIGKGEDTLS